MDPRRFALAVTALAVGLAIAWLMLTNDVRPASAAVAFAALGVGWSFIASGLVAWEVRPGNTLGPVMVLTGFLQIGTGLSWSQDPFLFTISHLLHLASFASVTFIVLAFPSGRLNTNVNRGLFGAALAVVGPLNVAWLLVGGQAHHSSSCLGCPEPLLQVTRSETAQSAILWAQEIGGGVVAMFAIAILLGRWRRATPRLRFAIAPVLWVGAGALTILLLYVLYSATFPQGPMDDLAWLAVNFASASVAMAFLVGVTRTRLARFGVADLVVDMGGASPPAALRDSLARVLHDPSLAIAYWLEDSLHFVDALGRTVSLPGPAEGRAVTMIERGGRRIAALLHDPALRDDEQLVESACAAAALQIENERLQADLRARLEEVEASRTRIVEATMAERRRIERDLHDGTQQRLVSVGMSLGLMESKVRTDPQAALAFVREARGRLSDALEELRALSQGIHPGLLTERGLAAALDELAHRVDLPVELRVSIAERLPERIEEAAYHVVSEALTNVLKHAHATLACVQVDRFDGVAVTRISDDGVGGADSTRGSGLRGLRDRVEALGGHMTVESLHARGTVVEARIPCVS